MASTNAQGLPIPELINLIRYSFRQSEVDEVQNILMDREKNMKIEMANLVRDRDAKVSLLEIRRDLAELEKLKIEEKLERVQRKCEELEETVTRLTEEKRVSSDRQERAEEELYDKLRLEDLKVATENKKFILITEKINELKNENLESKRSVGVYEEKLKCLDAMLVKKGKEIEDLKREKLAANQSLEELRLKQLEADQFVEKLKRQNAEANQNINELRLKRLESEREAELYKTQLEKLAPRIMTVEKELARILKVKVEDLGSVVASLYKSDGVMDENADFIDPKLEKDSGGNGSAQWNGDAANKGGRNFDHFLTKEDCSNAVQNSHGSHSEFDPPKVQNDDTDQDHEQSGPKGSGPHVVGMHVDGEVPAIRKRLFGAGCSSKSARSTPAAEDIIEISESDDETNPCRAAYIPDIIIDANVGADLMAEKFARSPSSSKTKKRNRSDCGDDSLINNEASTDSGDESCRDLCMEDLTVTPKSKKLGIKWMFEADMLKAFQEDEKLCMDAVCALYRQQIFPRKSTKSSSSSKNAKFSPDDSISGRALAEYLIDGDKELRLRKSVSEVKQERPQVVSQCQSLARNYREKLYSIYCSGKDPFFGQT